MQRLIFGDDGGLTCHDLCNEILGHVHRVIVGPHDPQGLTGHGVALLRAAVAGDGVAGDVPAGHIRQLHFYQTADVLIGHIGDHGVRHGIQHLTVGGEDGGRGGLVEDGLDHGHLVAATLVVTVREGVALPAESQSPPAQAEQTTRSDEKKA